MPPLARVLYLGVDGMDWEVLGPMIARGELPHLARLAREGVRAELQAFEPMVSPMLWTTAITGRGPDEHGIADFVVSEPDGDIVPIPSGFRTAPALWEILTAAGQPSGFVNFWATQPAEAIDGVLVSDMADRLIGEPGRPASFPAGIATPRSFLEADLARYATTDTLPAAAVRAYAPSLTDAEIEEARRFWREPALRQAWERAHPADDDRKTPIPAFLLKNATHVVNTERMGLALLADPSLGVVGLYFRDPDETGHNFQHLAPPPHPLASADERARFGGAVENAYRVLDGVVGRLAAAAGPNAAIVLHSDHGFRWGTRRPAGIMPYTKGQPVEWHRLQGVFLAAGGPFRRGIEAPPVVLTEITPLLLALRGVPADEAMPGRVRDDLLDPAAAARLPRQRVPAWAALVDPRRVETATGEELDAVQAQMVEALKGLGYVDDAKAPAAPASPGGADAGPGGQRPLVNYYRNLATWLMNENRFADAERALLEANAIKKLPKTYSLLSESRAARGDIRGARQALEDGFAAVPDGMPAESTLWLIELLLREGDVAGAEAALERLSATLGKYPAVRNVAQGRIAEARGDAARARSLYLQALAVDPRQTRAAERFAALAAGPAERAALVPYLERGLAADARIEVYWKMLGLMRLEAGDGAGALAALQRAAELEPNDEELAMTLATVLVRSGPQRGGPRDLRAVGDGREPARAGVGQPGKPAGPGRRLARGTRGLGAGARAGGRQPAVAERAGGGAAPDGRVARSGPTNRPCRAQRSRSRSAMPGRNAAARRAPTVRGAPVRGSRIVRSARSRTTNVPKPATATRSPRSRVSAIRPFSPCEPNSAFTTRRAAASGRPVRAASPSISS